MAGAVILSGCGGNVALGAFRPLKEAKYEVIGTDVEERLSPGRYLADGFKKVERALLELKAEGRSLGARINRNYVSQMKKLCEEYSPDSLLANPDPEVLALSSYRQELPVLLPSYEQKLATLDKYRAYGILEKSRAPVPKYYLPLNRRELEEGLSGLLEEGGCAFTNARASHGGESSGKIEDMESGMAHFKIFGEQLLLENLPGREYAVILLYRRGRCHLRGAFQKLKYGCGQGLKNISVEDKQLFKIARNGVGAISREFGERPQGTYHVDIKEDGEGKRKIMEINAGRALGGTPDSYLFYAGGINMPHIYTSLCMGEDVGRQSLQGGIVQLQMNNYLFLKGGEVRNCYK